MYPKIDVSSTGKNIGALMQINGYSVKDIQGYLDLSAPQAVYKWLWGANLPSIDNLFALSKLFGTPIDAILVEQQANNRDQNNAPAITVSKTEKGRTISYYLISLRAA